MIEDLRDKYRRLTICVRTKRYGALLVYLSIFLLALSGAFALKEMFGLNLNSLITAIVSKRGFPEALAALLSSGPLFAVFLFVSWKKPAPLTVMAFKDDQALEDYLRTVLPGHIKQAQMLQYTGDKSDKFMKQILQRGANVQLLLKHPETLEIPVQKDKMRLVEQRWRDNADPTRIEIRFYREDASVRGIATDGRVRGLSWYTRMPREKNDPTPWLYGHSNLHIGFAPEGDGVPEGRFFGRLFDALWKDSQPMWVKSAGRISKGHGVAGSKSEHYPAGAISLQTPFFSQRGVDISQYHPATLNIDISPQDIELVRHVGENQTPVAQTLTEVAWTDKHPPETFSFSGCWLVYQEKRYAGLVYYPHPETKIRHEQRPGIVEVLAPKIPIIDGEIEIDIELNSLEIRVVKQTYQDT